MKIDWRVSAIVAGSAFILSVLVGVIGNVSFGVIIIRAIIVAALFGSGAVGVAFVIDRYLPELRRTSRPSDAPNRENTVDIVVEGDLEYEGAAEASDESHGQLENEGAEEQSDIEPQSSAEGEDGVLGEIEESDGTGGGGRASAEGDVEEAEEIGERKASDDLPNVESMADSFTEVPLGEGTVDVSLDSGEEPELMARAIRTVLKRED